MAVTEGNAEVPSDGVPTAPQFRESQTGVCRGLFPDFAGGSDFNDG